MKQIRNAADKYYCRIYLKLQNKHNAKVQVFCKSTKYLAILRSHLSENRQIYVGAQRV